MRILCLMTFFLLSSTSYAQVSLEKGQPAPEAGIFLTKEQAAKVIAEKITDYVNSFSDKSEEFNNAMSNQHRTLQQSFTKLCLKWLEHCATNEYRFDGRNEGAHQVSSELIKLFKEAKEREGWTGASLEQVGKPSTWLRMI